MAVLYRSEITVDDVAIKLRSLKLIVKLGISSDRLSETRWAQLL